jgi:hypothetical protein
MPTELPTLERYFDSIVEVKDARFRDKCTMECEACDCTRAIKLPGKPLIDRLNLVKDVQKRESDDTKFTDFGRVVLNRRKQREGIDVLRNVVNESESSKIKPVIAGAAISGLYAVFFDGEYFRIKNIPDSHEAREIIEKIGLDIVDSVQSVKENAKHSLAGNNMYSNVV